MRTTRVLGALALSMAFAACDTPTDVADSCQLNRVNIPALAGDTVTTSSGLRYIVRTPGTGTVAQANSTVTVNYTGYLIDGSVFDSSAGRGPTTFSLAQVIPGFKEGITGMRVGGSRRLIIPANLAYGPQGQGCIPGNSPLIFDVDLLAVQ